MHALPVWSYVWPVQQATNAKDDAGTPAPAEEGRERKRPRDREYWFSHAKGSSNTRGVVTTTHQYFVESHSQRRIRESVKAVSKNSLILATLAFPSWGTPYSCGDLRAFDDSTERSRHARSRPRESRRPKGDSLCRCVVRRGIARRVHRRRGERVARARARDRPRRHDAWCELAAVGASAAGLDGGLSAFSQSAQQPKSR
jgi:hypothetical protein